MVGAGSNPLWEVSKEDNYGSLVGVYISIGPSDLVAECEAASIRVWNAESSLLLGLRGASRECASRLNGCRAFAGTGGICSFPSGVWEPHWRVLVERCQEMVSGLLRIGSLFGWIIRGIGAVTDVHDVTGISGASDKK